MSRGLVVVLCFAIVCTCVAVCVTKGPKAKEACKCEGCKCDPKWQVQGQINVKVIDHLRRNGVNIGDPATVGSAK